MEITLAKERHIPGILKLWKYLMDYHHGLDQRGLLRRSKQGYVNFQKHLKKQLKSKRNQVLVTLDKDKVIAYSMAGIIDYPPIYILKKYGLITNLCVDRAFQRKGIATRMMKEILAWF